MSGVAASHHEAADTRRLSPGDDLGPIRVEAVVGEVGADVHQPGRGGRDICHSIFLMDWTALRLRPQPQSQRQKSLWRRKCRLPAGDPTPVTMGSKTCHWIE